MRLASVFSIEFGMMKLEGRANGGCVLQRESSWKKASLSLESDIVTCYRGHNLIKIFGPLYTDFYDY